MIIASTSSGTAGRLSQADGALVRAAMADHVTVGSVTTYGCEGQVQDRGAFAPSPVWRAPLGL
jgi:hypothetical protein